MSGFKLFVFGCSSGDDRIWQSDSRNETLKDLFITNNARTFEAVFQINLNKVDTIMKPHRLAIVIFTVFATVIAKGQLFKPLGLGIESPKDLAADSVTIEHYAFAEFHGLGKSKTTLFFTNRRHRHIKKIVEKKFKYITKYTRSIMY